MAKGLGRREFVGTALGGTLGLAYAPSVAHSASYYDSGLKLLEMGAVKPMGWIKEQLRRDLHEGITGHYDKIDDTVARDVFGALKRRSSPTGIPLITINRRPAWWSGEHEGYWKDAVTRTAFLVDDKEHKDLAESWMERILDYQDSDGYIGVYERGNRFNHAGENGELWAQSRILVAMLAYHEYTGDTGVLDAANRAVDLVMANHGPSKSYFENSNSKLFNGGMSHGLAFVDVLEWLYRRTGEDRYKLFAEFLYRDFSRHCVCNNDIGLPKLLDPGRKFELHGAHVAEHFMIPFFLARTIGKDEYRQASKNAMAKLQYHLTPSKALVSYENVNGESGTADALYEYCCITEMAISLIRVAQFNGDIGAADLVEQMTLNAGQAARMPVLKACSYLTRDNRTTINRFGRLGREGYSASHFAAACCTLNAGRLMPHYISGMWMRKSRPDGLAAMLYGPCELETSISGVKVNIREETAYPFSDRIVFHVDPETPISFTLLFRIPGFVSDMRLEGADVAAINRDGFLEITRTWNRGDKLTLAMIPQVEIVTDTHEKWRDGEKVYAQRGPLLYGLKIPAKIREVREHNDSGFYDYDIKPAGEDYKDYRLITDAEFELVENPDADPEMPWEEAPIGLACELRDKKGALVKDKLVPEGCAILRRVSLPKG